MSTWLHWAGKSALVGNVAWNLAGTVLPLAVGLVTIPPLLAVLGIALPDWSTARELCLQQD